MLTLFYSLYDWGTIWRTVHSKQTSIFHMCCVVSLTVVAPPPHPGWGGKYTAVATSLPPDLWFTDQRSNLAGGRRSLAGLAAVVAGSPGDGARAGVEAGVLKTSSLSLSMLAGTAGVRGFGGRPCLAGAAGDAAAAPLCGFRRSTVTETSFPPMSTLKNLGPFSMTR